MLQDVLAGRYTIHEMVGSGGMANVYRATDLHYSRMVAVKVMRPEVVAAGPSQRFLREISIAARLSHPNIVPLFDSGEAGGLLYYVMPLIDGTSVATRIRDEVQLSVDEALRIATQVGAALTYAHGNGVVHRDIKPDNILLQSGTALVTDFGIARAIVASGDFRTSTGVSLGTPLYMSPEQTDGDRQIDAKTDQYSLAMVLYEMLTGEAPFKARTMAGIVAQKNAGQHPSIRTLRPAVPPQISAAIDRALQPVPADRFESVADFIAALGRQTHVRAFPRRLRWPWGALAAMAVAAVITGVVVRQRRMASTVAVGRIVVAPLENRTDDASLDALGLMAADWLTEGLQRTRAVEVVPTPSVFQASRQMAERTGRISMPARAIAQETGAASVVSGSYYRQGDSLTFEITVSDRGGSRVAAALPPVRSAVSTPMAGVQALRDRLMGWVALQYDDHGPTTASTIAPPSYEAYRSFSDGMDRYIVQENAQAVPLFLRAYQLDSSFAPALLYASLALTNTGAWVRADSLLSIVDRRRNQLSAYDRAWLDYRLGFVRGRPDQTLGAIREAARIAPGSKAVYNLAVTAFQTGHVREALAAIRSLPSDRGAMRGFVPYWSLEGAVLHALGDYKAERAAGESARAAYPDRLAAFVTSARVLATSGDTVALNKLLDEARNKPADPYLGDYSRLLNEAVQELRAHAHVEQATKYGEALVKWIEGNGRGADDEFTLVQTLYALGKYDEARSQLAKLRAADPRNVDYLGTAGLLAARLGDADESRAIDDSLANRREAYLFGAPAAYRARLAAIRGDTAAAVVDLDQAFAEGLAYQLWLHRDASLMLLRGDAAFDRIVHGKS